MNFLNETFNTGAAGMLNSCFQNQRQRSKWRFWWSWPWFYKRRMWPY